MVGTPSAPINLRERNQYISLLGRCSGVRHLRAAHALLLTHGLHRHIFSLSRLILAACSLPPIGLSYASLLFLHSPSPPNSFIHNTLIRAYARSPQPHRALHYFLLLLRAPPHASPDHHTFPFALAACASDPSLPSTQIHATVLKNGLAPADHFVQTALLRAYSPSTTVTRKVFDEIPNPDVVHWDVLMNSYISSGLPSVAIRMFSDMLLSGRRPDAHVVTTALTACSHAGAYRQGVWIHQYLESKEPSFLRDTFVGSALVSMYAKCGSITDAAHVFDSMRERNTYIWSAMIGGLAMHGAAREAVGCLRRMQEEDGLRPDGIVILGALVACSHAGLVDEGLLLLADMEEVYGVVPGHEHFNCAVDMLCRLGRLEEAVGMIERMPMRPLAPVWGSVLAACRTYGNVELAELAAGELQRIGKEGGEDEGVYVQLSNIYLKANKPEDARRVRKLIGSRGSKKVAGVSDIEVEGVVSSFVAGDQVHPQKVEIWEILNCLMDQMSSCLLTGDLAIEATNVE